MTFYPFNRSVFSVLGIFVCFFATRISAADRYFTNSLGGNFTNKTLWMTGVIPTNSDNANFTNNVSRKIDWTVNATNANAFFNTTIDTTYTQNIGSVKWFVTNQYIVAQNAGTTSTVDQISGTLIVTNAGGTSSMVVGRTGNGTFILDGGTVMANHLYVTNLQDSSFAFNAGTLTVLSDSRFETNGSDQSLNIGGSTTATATMNILGGTTYFGTNLYLGGTTNIATGILNISGSSTIVSNMGSLYVGYTGIFNQVTMTNGATMYVDNKVFIGSRGGCDSNTMVVSGAGTSFQSGLESTIGGFGAYNTLIVSNNATYGTTFIFLGSNVGTSSNFLYVTDGGQMTATSLARVGQSGSSNTMVVTGIGSKFSGTTVHVGSSAGANRNEFIVSNGGTVSNSSTSIGFSGDENTVLITDSGSTWTNTGTTFIGRNGSTNTLVISNGGVAYSGDYIVGTNALSDNNKVVVTGPGSLLYAVNSVVVGSNSYGSGSGVILLSNEGTLEAGSITNGLFGTGNITNAGGVIQFRSSTPTVVTNAGGTIVVTNGTISYRNIANAPVYITNQVNRMTFSGSNSLMLNQSTNFILSSYTFTNGLGGTNYSRLILLGDGALWQATNTLVGAGSAIYITNSTATTFGTITNSGTIQLAGPSTTVTNQGLVVINGSGAGNGGSILNVSGTNTFDGPVRLGANSSIGSGLDQITLHGTITNAGFLLTVTNAGSSSVDIASLISGTGGLSHNGTGTLSLASSNSFSGPITNNAGTLSIDQKFAISGVNSSVIVNGGTLLFNAIVTNTAATVVLNGGVIQEVDTNVSLGALTISANSSMQLNSGGNAGRFTFASGTNTVGSGANLTIYGWTANSSGSGSDDLIFFTNSTFESARFLDNVTFFGTGGGARLLSTGELVPITPEPNTLLAGFFVMAMFVRHLRFRLRCRIR